jgi:hypothetical protein
MGCLGLLNVGDSIAKNVLTRRKQIRIRFASVEQSDLVFFCQEFVNDRPTDKLGSTENKNIHICSMELRATRLSEFPATRLLHYWEQD